MTSPLDKPGTLNPKPFFKRMIGSTARLSCGRTQDGTKANDWLHDVGYPTVRTELNRGTRVWLYENSDKLLVGFGSLGTASWLIGGVPTVVQFIPMLGVFEEFQGLPAPESGEDKYCYQILSHIIDEAELRISTSRWLGLSVRKEHAEAIHIYTETGFEWLENNRGLSRMALRLTTSTEV